MNIENCKVGFRCPKTIDALVETADPSIRYCSECDRGVHLCTNAEEFGNAVERGWCVVIVADQKAGHFDNGFLDELGPDIFIGKVTATFSIKDENKSS